MGKRKEIVEFLFEGGSGSEAKIRVELRTKFRGIGGTLITHEGVASALRIDLNPTPQSGHKIFLKHVIAKKLDDYFYRKGIYKFSHIPRSLGSISQDKEPFEAYIYEWVFGTDRFSWDIVPRDWDVFKMNFIKAGINVGDDCTSFDNQNISQNIILQHGRPVKMKGKRMWSCLWKRIDFGDRSLPIDYEKLKRFLAKNERDLIKTIRTERFVMVWLAIQYIQQLESPNSKEMEGIKIGNLEMLVGDYRRAMLNHYAMGFGPARTPVVFDRSVKPPQTLKLK